MLEGLHGSFVKLESAVDTAMVNVGEGVSGVLIPVLDQLAKSATAVGDAFDSTEKQQSEAAKKTIEDWKKVQSWYDGYQTWFEERTGIAAEKAEEALRDRIQAQAEESWAAWREGRRGRHRSHRRFRRIDRGSRAAHGRAHPVHEGAHQERRGRAVEVRPTHGGGLPEPHPDHRGHPLPAGLGG